MATFQEAINSALAGHKFEYKKEIFHYDKESNKILSENDIDFFCAPHFKTNSQDLFSNDFEIIHQFIPRKYEFEDFLGENDCVKKICDYAIGEEFNHYCILSHTSLFENNEKIKKISKWKVTMEEIEIEGDEE